MYKVHKCINFNQRIFLLPDWTKAEVNFCRKPSLCRNLHHFVCLPSYNTEYKEQKTILEYFKIFFGPEIGSEKQNFSKQATAFITWVDIEFFFAQVFLTSSYLILMCFLRNTSLCVYSEEVRKGKVFCKQRRVEKREAAASKLRWKGTRANH